jgi:hypothetical protein
MSPGRIAVGQRRTARAILALAAALACLGAVAYAATRPAQPAVGLGGRQPLTAGSQHGDGAPQGSGEETLLRARFLEAPEATSTVTETQFRFHVPPRAQRGAPPAPGSSGEAATSKRRFQCRLDGGDWVGCSSPYALGNLALGNHAFAVRAFNRANRPGPAVSYSWQQAARPVPAVDGASMPFTIEAAGELEDLFPGYPPQPVPLLITNPNSVPIEVTSITVAITADPPGCPAENFALSPAGVSPEAPLAVPANSSVSLPTVNAAAPAITMLNLPINQDACRGVRVPLAFSGEAHG